VNQHYFPKMKSVHVVMLMGVLTVCMGQGGADCDCDIVELINNGVSPDQLGDQGACCTDAMDCRENTFRVDCAGDNQRFFQDRNCGEVDCETGLRVGACCLDDGSCVLLISNINCDGEFLGQGSACTDCGEGTTDVTEQACCLPNGACELATETDCAARDGTAQGPAVDCDSADCSENLSDEFGCCLSDGITCENQTMEDCMSVGGFPSTQRCIDILDCGVFINGACCIGTNCQIRSKSTCDALSGSFQGGDSACDPSPCS